METDRDRERKAGSKRQREIETERHTKAKKFGNTHRLKGDTQRQREQ